MSETLARLYRHAIAYDRPDMMLTKSDGQYRPHLRPGGRAPGGAVARASCAARASTRAIVARCCRKTVGEWAVGDFAMMTAGIVSVPLYPTLTTDQVQYMLEHSGARAAMVSSADQLAKIQSVWGRLPLLEGVIVFDEVESDDDRVISLGSLIGDGPLTPEQKEALETSINEVEPEDLASIIYTSGTTGTPKGVMLTHANFGDQCSRQRIRLHHRRT